ncbi:hypothetical protein [Psychrobium sp. 1_MG-2023]|uniref:hypothetical protein n=1 Tax=Psychrobium sp. 1_MG-2023 TaxID=3062624 RepID=UPI000C323F3D|nr:hypothetical protein [Psychrobium sp. 1_MG-2023]MDP2559909.1 hypothetical protein [Psychrobium sp. 1_MG-2023]PKF58990.1 hypothetical protein CW748_02035 [Alteromonadales bacterium alter-6D02]
MNKNKRSDCYRRLSWERLSKKTITVMALGLFYTAPIQAITPLQTYYVPFTEAQVSDVLSTLHPEAIGKKNHAVISISIGYNGTTIHYDHHEDSYETNLLSPLSSTTQIWGDGNDANGKPPGFASDVLNSGDVIILNNEMPVDYYINDPAAIPPNVPYDPLVCDGDGDGVQEFCYDGQDKFVTDKPVAVTRVGWVGTWQGGDIPNPEPGTLLAGAVEVYPTSEWGTSFEAPLGEPNSMKGDGTLTFPGFPEMPDHDGMFELVSNSIMATSDGTVLRFDLNGDADPTADLVTEIGKYELVVTLDEGESFMPPLIPSGPITDLQAFFPLGSRVYAGTATSLESTQHVVQVHGFTGDIGARYESRWAAILPKERWSDEYFMPVSTSRNSLNNDYDPTDVFLYNPGDSSLSVCWQTMGGEQTVIVIEPNELYRQQAITDGSGARFISCGATAGETFWGIATIDSDWDRNPDGTLDDEFTNESSDWAIALASKEQLSTELLVGFAPGVDPNLCQPGAPFDCSGFSPSGSPVWVMADDLINNTTVSIDYDGDSIVDHTIVLTPLERAKVFDPSDNDMTGARLFTTNGTKLTAAWGQDPANSEPAFSYFDVGTTIPGLPMFTEEGGGEGCTPGYWKQRHHFGSWASPYVPTMAFEDAFSNNVFGDMTLLEVLKQGGGGIKALGRHSVAALLNAAASSVSYDLNVAQVISGFNTATDTEAQKNIFEKFNELGCPLGRSSVEESGIASSSTPKKGKAKHR